MNINVKNVRGIKEEEEKHKNQEIIGGGWKSENAVIMEDRSLIFENKKEREWLTTKEAAEYLRVSPKSLLNQTSNGTIRHFKFGRRNRFLLSDLREILLAQPRGRTYGN